MENVNIDKDEIVRLSEEYGGQWGINHTRRLLRLVAIIGEGQTYDADVIWLAAYLHDWGAYAPWAQKGVDHALRSKQVAETFLTERGYPDSLKARVLECIEFHHSGKPDRSIESILLSDADALDFLGVVGFARDFARNPKDLRKGYETTKEHRTRLAKTILLDKSKEMAAKRIAEMEQLYAAFEEETFGNF